ncbi:MAG: HlyD family efflux transporter periplasmic adaptor subunit, partial [Pirellulales bacterium]|nr:HlyD family efflux transporter periplasmic adaptor subunit [Pirellulales bacterium]
MADSDSTHAPVASWMQLEHYVERLHAAARSPLGVREFYRRLLADAAEALGAVGGAAWRAGSGERLELVCQSLDPDAGIEVPSSAERHELLHGVMRNGEAAIHSMPAHSSSRKSTAVDFDALACPVPLPGAKPASGDAAAVFELWIPARAGPLAKQGWLDFAATIAEVASDFHALEELRRLREGEALHRQAVELLRRVQGPRDLTGAAFELANEGRRVLGCDRLSVVVRRGGRWRLLSTSGATRVQRRNDFTRRTERLADAVARWGEPIAAPVDAADGAELPPRLASAIEEHIDHSHARELACAPVSFTGRQKEASEDTAKRRSRKRFDAVLIAESFEAADKVAWRHQLVELGELCGPVLGRAAALDRFPMRTMLRWSDRLSILRQPARLFRALLILGALAAAVAALVYVPADFDVEAPATLVAAVERDVFATATGSVAALRVEHGQMVKQNDVLVILSDPELALKLQQVRGEIEAARKRLDALAVTRTERTLREQDGEDRLPLSAEQRQLEERLASLEAQRTLLESRRDALTIRSPLSGQVLTRNVQSLLESRPVERGQVLLTIADASSGWQLKADVPQRQIGHVLEAQRDEPSALAASLRLAGDVEKT